MAEFTQNLNLELPDKAEQYNVAVQNSNMQKIDDFSKLIPPRALTADKFTTGVKINDVFFDGTKDIVLEGLDNSLTYNNISNCLLENPQNINLELKDGVLTLKKGSTVIVPNGANNFEHKSSSSDLSRSAFGTQSGENIYIELVVNKDTLIPTGLTWSTASNTVVGTTAPSSGVFYDTANNEIYNYTSAGKQDRRSLPVALVKMQSGTVTEITQVFNGSGFFGDYPWCDKGVKVLIPNGRNEDGTLNNIEVITPKVLINLSIPYKPTVATTNYEVRINGTRVNPAWYIGLE